jgi:hypothetical protein
MASSQVFDQAQVGERARAEEFYFLRKARRERKGPGLKAVQTCAILSGLKPTAAGDESPACLPSVFSQRPVKPADYAPLTAGLKPCPFKAHL